jgi:hypothetical protein
MAWTSDLLTGAAEYLAAAGVGVWSPTGTYTDTDTGIVIGRMPATPDRAIVLALYDVDTTSLSHVLAGLQVRCRGPRTSDPRPVSDLADAVYEALHGAQHVTLGGVRVPLIWRQSHAWIGADDNRREETASNFYLHAGRPSAHVND